MGVTGIHHVGLVVDDLARAVEFYGALLAMEVVERDHWEAPAELEDQAVGLIGSAADGVMMRGSASYLELWQYHSPTTVGADPGDLGANERGWRHLAIEVDDVAAEWRRVQELGGTAMGEPVMLSDDGAAVVYCRDPFGNVIELMSTGRSMASLNDLKTTP